ncbi:MAG: DUF4838 domain-containing protein, partial [Planctomycetes bacterium]|nr:DUF4838 domain-containing protein [Planctomycetota bacterium]
MENGHSPSSPAAQSRPSVGRLLAVLMILATFGLPSPALGQERLFEVVTADKVPFNYPPPPREGRADFFAVAENGQARCVIVQPAEASKGIQRVATLLPAYLQLATGARFSVIADGGAVPEGLGVIHVGDTAVGLRTELNLPDARYGDEVLPNLGGYLIKTLDPRTLVIRGRTETATVNGVVGFLKRYVGVRQYWVGKPGSLGEVIPSRPTLRVPELEWRDWPYCFSRTMSERPFFGDRGQALGFYRKQETLRCSENYDAWLPPKQYGPTNPDFFSLISGKRRVPTADSGASGWQPCASNPNVVRVMGDAVADYFRKNPDAVGINFSINDGGGDCMCEGCRAMDAPNADYSRQIGMSDRYVKLTIQVCERVRREFPSKLVVYLAYAAGRLPPKTVAPDPMLLPVLTTPGNAFEAWDQWMKTGVRHLGLYVHHDDLFFILPKFDLRQAAKRIRYVVASGRMRVFYMEMHTSWPFNDIVPYVIAELLWDPRQDVDAMLNEYYTSFYGPAGEPMRAFHRALEGGYERWLQEEGEPHWFGKDISSIRHGRSWEQFRVLTPEEAARASAALTQAAAAAKTDAKAAERIHIVRLMFGLQELAVRRYWTAHRLKDGPANTEADARRIVDDARGVLALGREMSDYIQNTLEKPPVNALALFRQSPRKLDMYAEMKSGQPPPEVLAAIGTGVDAAVECLRKNLGPEKAAAWWRNAQQAEKEQSLQATFEAAEMRSKGIEIKNLATDPGFEGIGRKLAPDEFAVDAETVLRPDQEGQVGIHQWFPERSPYRIVLSRKEPHSGRYSLMIEHCHRARLSQHA